MPRKDQHHDTVVSALKKAGWTNINEQELLMIGQRRLYIDIYAERNDTGVAIRAIASNLV